MKLVAFALLPIALFATVNDPLRIELLSGYRNDLVHWHLTRGETFLSGERTRNIQFWENELSLQATHRDIAFYAAGGYGAFGRGELKEEIGDLPTFTFFTHGWAVDGTGYLGYAVNLTPDRTYRVILLPLAGFSGHYEVMARPGSSTVETDSSEVTSSFPKNYQQTWYGPYIGAGFRIEPGNRLLFRAGYAYHWLHLRVSSEMREGASDLPTTTDKFTLNRWGNYGHSGWAQMDYQLDRSWQVGAALQLNYYFSGNHPVEVQESVETVSVEIRETFKLRWFSIRGLVAVSRGF